MNVYKNCAALVVIVLLSSNLLAAPVGTAKARGDYRGFWQSQGRSSQPMSRYSVPSRGYRAPAARYSTPMYARSAPVMISSEPLVVSSQPIVAESQNAAIAAAPAEGRRFSYSPAPAVSTDLSVGGSCAAVRPAPRAAATTVQGRRFSYNPAGSARSRSTSVERWQVPKADPRKYSGR